MPVVEISCSFGYEEIEEWENRKEMSETDIEISGDTDRRVEENEEHGKILGGALLERMSEN